MAPPPRALQSEQRAHHDDDNNGNDFDDEDDDEQVDDSGPFTAAGSAVLARLSSPTVPTEVALIVGNLAASITQRDMTELCANYAPTNVQVFTAPGSETVVAHVSFTTSTLARSAREKFNGLQLDGA